MKSRRIEKQMPSSKGLWFMGAIYLLNWTTPSLGKITTESDIIKLNLPWDYITLHSRVFLQDYPQTVTPPQATIKTPDPYFITLEKLTTLGR